MEWWMSHGRNQVKYKTIPRFKKKLAHIRQKPVKYNESSVKRGYLYYK